MAQVQHQGHKFDKTVSDDSGLTPEKPRRGQVTLMPSGMRNPNAVDFVCPTCGKATLANRRTGLLNGHNRPSTHKLCPASRTVVMPPDRTLPAAAPGTHNPDTVMALCPGCDREIRTNRRTGLLYSHQLPDSTEVCSSSAAALLPPEGGPPPFVLQPATPETPPVRRFRTRLRDASQSVRTVRGGLPGLGRRK
jgi:hypothetical protein